MFIIDMRFHYYLRTWLNCTLDVIGTVLVIVGALPLFILGIIPLVFLYFTIQVSTRILCVLITYKFTVKYSFRPT